MDGKKIVLVEWLGWEAIRCGSFERSGWEDRGRPRGRAWECEFRCPQGQDRDPQPICLFLVSSCWLWQVILIGAFLWMVCCGTTKFGAALRQNNIFFWGQMSMPGANTWQPSPRELRWHMWSRFSTQRSRTPKGWSFSVWALIVKS